MNLHEYQAKELLKKYSVPVQEGIPVDNAGAAEEAYKHLRVQFGNNFAVVKAQIHAGGRGKGKIQGTEQRGVAVGKSAEDIKQIASNLLGGTLVTIQTGSAGKKVNKVLIAQDVYYPGANPVKEFYLSVLLDRAKGQNVIMYSTEGGMDIEEVAEHNPNAIKKVDIDPTVGLMPFQARELAFAIGMDAALVGKATKFFQGLYNAFIATDCSIAEINPLVVTKEGDVFALDAKMNFDSNALFRHPDIVEMRDLNEEEPSEIEASKFDLAFIKLDGNIGCLVNGAGLAMATLDIIKLHGAEPANFLDVGGGANKEKVTEAFKIILKDPNVKGILVNIFGGIMKCDIIAEGVIAASKELGLKVPLVCRLEGTNVELGKKMLRESGLNITPADDLTDAAKKIVAAIKG